MISGSDSIIEHAAITAARVLISNSDGLPIASSITSTTLSYLDVGSSITGLLSDKVSTTGDESIDGIKTFTSFPQVTGTPTNNADLVNKSYADSIAQGFLYKRPVEAATTTALPACTYNNGTSGVGATLTGNSNGALGSQDGVTLSVSDTLLVKDQSSALENGVYEVTQVGNAGAPFILTRRTDLDGTIVQGNAVLVLGGTTQASEVWAVSTADPITVGTTGITWIQIGQVVTYTGGNGVLLSGNSFSARLASNQGLAFSGADIKVDYDNSTVGIVTNKLALLNTAVSSGTYGSNTRAPVITVDAQGRITSASQSTIVREVLSSSRNYYVRTDGSDSNTGLINNSGGAFLTIQKAINVVAGLDINTQNVTINIADGTYTGAVLATGPWLGSGVVTLLGNTTTPANVIISVTGNDAIKARNGASLTISGMEIRTTTLGQGVRVESGGFITIGSSIRFGAIANSQIYCETNGNVFGRSPYSVVGSAEAHLEAVTSGAIDLAGITVTVTGTPSFSRAFALASRVGVVQVNANTYSGSATGSRYNASSNGVIFTNGGSSAYLPGNSSGATATGGQYV